MGGQFDLSDVEHVIVWRGWQLKMTYVGCLVLSWVTTVIRETCECGQGSVDECREHEMDDRTYETLLSCSGQSLVVPPMTQPDEREGEVSGIGRRRQVECSGECSGRRGRCSYRTWMDWDNGMCEKNACMRRRRVLS
jgi:hypothetical protein